MAKFCGNCGTKMDDNAKICGQCGAPMDDDTKTFPVKKVFQLVVVLVLVVAVVVTTINIVSKFTGYNGLIRKVMSAYQDYDIDALVALSSDMYYYNDYEEYADEYFKSSMETNIESLESSVGHNYKMSYKIEEIYNPSQYKQDNIIENIEYYYPDFDVDMISEIVIAEVKITAKQGSKSVSRDVEITMSKEGKAWRLLYLG